MCKPEELLSVTPLTTVDKPLAYSERTMRIIAQTTLQWTTTMEPRSVYVRKFMQEMEPWINLSDKGKMTTRIVNYLFKHYEKASIPSVWQQAIGNYLAAEAPTGAFHYDIVNRFNWKRGDFGDSGSCFFSSRTNVLRTLEDEGGYAMRFFKKSGNTTAGMARAFLLPHPSKPTVPILFNAYGCNIDQYISRLRAILGEVPMKMVYLNNKGSNTGDLYVNQNMGVVIGEEGEDWEETLDFQLETHSRSTRCNRCNARGAVESLFDARGSGVGEYCPSCMTYIRAVRCELSNNMFQPNAVVTVEVVGRSVDHPTHGYPVANLITITCSEYNLSRHTRPHIVCESCHRPHPYNGRIYVYDEARENGFMNVCYHCGTDYSLVCRHCGCYLHEGATCACPETRSRGANTYRR